MGNINKDKVFYHGYLKNVITMYGENLEVGDLVVLAEDGSVKEATTGDKICGVVTTVRNGYCGVQTTGYTEIACTDAVLPGFNKFLAVDKNSVGIDGEGREYLVVDVALGKAGIILG